MQTHQKALAEADIAEAWQVYQDHRSTEVEMQRVAQQCLQLPPPTPAVQYFAGVAAALSGRPRAQALLTVAQAGGQLPDPWLAALGYIHLSASRYAQQAQALLLVRASKH